MMKRVRFIEDQIIGVLRQYEAGGKTGVLPEAGLSDLKAELEQLATDARRSPVAESASRQLVPAQPLWGTQNLKGFSCAGLCRAPGRSTAETSSLPDGPVPPGN